MGNKKEFGDFQTPDSLAKAVVSVVSDLFVAPELIIEPTAGIGAFLTASFEQWGAACEYKGYEINANYVAMAQEKLGNHGIQIFHRDFFSEDWDAILNPSGGSRVLVIGNLPWVTNSDLGQLGSKNLPVKSNFQGLRGISARTGKSNFDIAEWMLIRLIEALPTEGAVAILCKTTTARKVLRHFWRSERGFEGVRLFRINAQAEFHVAVDACLFFITGKPSKSRVAETFDALDATSNSTQFGFIDGDLVSDIGAYQRYRHLDGIQSYYTWRSGLKHDAAKVMELTHKGGLLLNGYGETVDIEDDYVFPLLKSSDLGNGRQKIRKSVLVTQFHTGDDTEVICQKAPKTWAYLLRYAEALDGRKSSIYINRPRFSIFGIGAYSFATWKIAISGLYKNLSFVIIPPLDQRPVMIDDTCYSIPCQSLDEAKLLLSLLSSEIATVFLRSLIFTDAKRPITVDVLRRLSFTNLARSLGKLRVVNYLALKGEACVVRHNIRVD